MGQPSTLTSAPSYNPIKPLYKMSNIEEQYTIRNCKDPFYWECNNNNEKCNRVHFCEELVSRVIEIPRIDPSEQCLLYYSGHELQKLMDELRCQDKVHV